MTTKPVHIVDEIPLHVIKRKADEFGIQYKLALWHRKRYLTHMLGWVIDEYNSSTCEVGIYLLHRDMLEIKRQIKVIDAELKRLEERKGDQITDEMIERARTFPVELLVEFKRGKATAWCHPDRNPSLFHGNRKNLAVCPVCDKKFGPIDILMTRDSMTFTEAVRKLQI